MNLLTKAHAETHEILNNVRADYRAGNITREQMNDIVLGLFKHEAERQILGQYSEPTEADDAARMAGYKDGTGYV